MSQEYRVKVAKFGGSSVASSWQFRKVRDIVAADPARRFVVVSAVGKRDKHDVKVTDLLYLVNAHLHYHVSCDDLFGTIGVRLSEIARELGISYPISQEFGLFRERAKTGCYTEEFIVSRGEYFTARMMAEFLDMPFVDAADAVVFNHDGTLNKERTGERLRKAAQDCAGRFVMPGFYGATEDGQIKLFDRGGSDISGSVVARCLDADLYENWTDVSGFLTADPRIVDDSLPIPHVTYAELRELSYMGASVLHEDAVFPVKEAGIPLVIKNTNRPDDAGTVISAADDAESRQIAGVTGRRGFVAVRTTHARSVPVSSALCRVLAVVERFRVDVERVSTGLGSCTLLFEADTVKECLYPLVAAIEHEAGPESLEVVKDLALVSTVGRALPDRPELSGRLFDALGRAGIDVPFASRNPEEISVTVGVQEASFEDAIRAIYAAFVS